MNDHSLQIADRTFSSRLFIGSARYPDPDTMLKAWDSSGAELVTVSMRRVNLENIQDNPWIDLIDRDRYQVLPNTAGCYTATEAILVAELAREALDTNWVKLEVIADDESLLPDSSELLVAAERLVTNGFVVLPYCTSDPVLCRRLADVGCAAVMPLASPIGSGRGIDNPYQLILIKEAVNIPVIVDAGIGTASDVTIAMELGLDGVLLNTAVAEAKHPVLMAEAMAHAWQAGRAAYLAGRIPRRTCGYSRTRETIDVT